MRPFAVEMISWCWWTWVPAFARSLILKLLDRKARRHLRAAVSVFLAQDSSGWTDEMLEVARFLKAHPWKPLPYPFALNLPRVDVARDPANHLFYVVHNGKRMYFPKTWAAEKIEVYFGGLLIEQDVLSPHRYEMEPCVVTEGDVVVDAGASEGFFALSVIDKCRKVYLIECDELWSEALHKTFEPWSDKVVFLASWLADKDTPNEGRITLDTLLGEEQVDFLKADIEGSECALLRGSSKIMARSPNMRAAVCSYHTDTDAAELETLLSEAGFSTSFSRGFMAWITDHGVSLRRGVLRAIKRRS